MSNHLDELLSFSTGYLYMNCSCKFLQVWGCAASSALEDQQKLKAWQNKQAEKHRKVPLPGNWDDNPDKTLLEMAGFKFSDERRRMELESKH
ncbi:hypothetical protein OESDEN_16767 [Oesophagostomum dentatum]|uniref:Uncharacterized protein n=1 Tax=Oesophagostomum dentatum TaxID=61180 RepID=A0A0B1SJY5_OESDE|nr:hypothetical protein OESDEN_16767 [Oesophagostomum dentatum]